MRIIGIRHRIKRTKEGEARPTQVVIQENGEMRTLELADDNDELDFVLGRLPQNYRRVTKQDDVRLINSRFIRRKKIGYDQRSDYPPHHLLQDSTDGMLWSVATHIPSRFEGLSPNDIVAMVLGGSGDNFAYALSKRAEGIGARVLRIPPFLLTQARAEADRNNDAILLAHLAKEKPELFYETGPRDRQLIAIREAFRARTDTMKQRIACEQRVFQQLNGEIFRNEDGHFPEGEIEKEFDKAKANDVILQNLLKEEGKREGTLQAALDACPVYQQIFEPIEGVGPMTAARLIGSIIDIRRFANRYKLVKFCGCHVMLDGRFPRLRGGEMANWSPDARHAMFLLGEQFNRRPDSFWGKKLLENKARLKKLHPEVVVDEKGKKKYTPGHLQKIGLWRTRTQFVRHLYRAWWDWQDRVIKEEKEKAA